MIRLDLQQPIWDNFFLVAPLVVIGTREPGGGYDLAPKHMAMPIGWENYFGFVCTPQHHTYQNICREQAFTVSFPKPEQVVLASLSAAPRCGEDTKPALAALPTVSAMAIDGVLLQDAYLWLECKLERIIDGFGQNSLITGKIVAAQVQEQFQRISDHDDQDTLRQAPLLVYLSPGYYSKMDQGTAFPFHVGFQR
jgi:flavin reductase (DIM6/NTAB) family NADH-FMN oxidoreductase RutF